MKGGPGKEAGSNQHLRLYLTTALIVSHQGDKILLFLEGSGSSTRFRWIKATTYNELNQLSYTIAHRLAQYLEGQGLMATKHDYLAIADFKCMVVRFISVALQSNCFFKHHSYSDGLFPCVTTEDLLSQSASKNYAL